MKSEDSVIVYDESRVSQIEPSLFEAQRWTEARRTTGKAGGRGAVLFVQHEGQAWVLRHYYRGGLPGKLLNDQFVWLGEAATRSWREWELLRVMRAQGLPVPVPIAARYVRSGMLYTADLITLQLSGVVPFSTHLAAGDPPGDTWQSVGACIARFHAAGFFHADLNAHNLQIDTNNQIYLLDWDRGEQRPPGRWCEANLSRLQRSLRKIARNSSAQYSESGWQQLLQGYRQVRTD